MIDSLQAAAGLTGCLRFCSLQHGWKTVLLRHYEHPKVVEHFEAPPLPDHNIVLVVKGSTLIESFSGGRWVSSQHVPGSLAMTAPGTGTRIRWHGRQGHETVHLVLPKETMASAAEELNELQPASRTLPSGLCIPDPLVSSVVKAVWKAGQDGAPEIYAQSAVHFLALHLLSGGPSPGKLQGASGGEMHKLRRVEEYMVAHLANQVTLEDFAAEAGCTVFRLIRLCRSYWGETPFQRLTRIRMEHGRELLGRRDASIMAVSLECGYSNPSHFATAFRREYGLSPSKYRQVRFAH